MIMSNITAVRSGLSLLAVGLILGLGCNNAPAEPTPAPEVEPPAPAPATPEPTEAAPSAAADSEVPVVEDFEGEVERTITVDNYKSQLASLEAELAP